MIGTRCQLARDSRVAMILVLVDEEERKRENGSCRWSAHGASCQETVAVAMVLVLDDDEESQTM